MLRVLNNVQLLDEHIESGASVLIMENQYGEQYLTVNTSNAQTSCTIRLNMYSNIHGKVLTDEDIREEVDTFTFEGKIKRIEGLSLHCHALSSKSQRL